MVLFDKLSVRILPVMIKISDVPIVDINMTMDVNSADDLEGRYTFFIKLGDANKRTYFLTYSTDTHKFVLRRVAEDVADPGGIYNTVEALYEDGTIRKDALLNFYVDQGGVKPASTRIVEKVLKLPLEYKAANFYYTNVMTIGDRGVYVYDYLRSSTALRIDEAPFRGTSFPVGYFAEDLDLLKVPNKAYFIFAPSKGGRVGVVKISGKSSPGDKPFNYDELYVGFEVCEVAFHRQKLFFRAIACDRSKIAYFDGLELIRAMFGLREMPKPKIFDLGVRERVGIGRFRDLGDVGISAAGNEIIFKKEISELTKSGIRINLLLKKIKVSDEIRITAISRAIRGYIAFGTHDGRVGMMQVGTKGGAFVHDPSLQERGFALMEELTLRRVSLSELFELAGVTVETALKAIGAYGVVSKR